MVVMAEGPLQNSHLETTTSANVIVVMGVAGAGKTAVGRALAAQVKWRFLEGDAYHSPTNIAKMSRGIALTDDDRLPWLAALRDVIADVLRRGDHAVLACSALKHSYREMLRLDGAPEGAIRFVYLDVPPHVLAERLATRQHHFAPPELLNSQLETLEKPRDALWVDGTASVESIVNRVITAFDLSPKVRE
jgi:gluconokinase